MTPDEHLRSLRKAALQRHAYANAAWEKQMTRARPGGDIEGQWSRAARSALAAWDRAEQA